MKKVLMTLAAASLATVFCFAQDPHTMDSQNQGANSNAVHGCLSGLNGNYILTESQSGTFYTLTGSTDALSGKVGHEIEVSGQMTTPASDTSSNSTSDNSTTTSTNSGSSSSGNAASGNSSSSRTIRVESVKDVADHCPGTAGPSSASSATTTSAGSMDASPSAATTSTSAPSSAGPMDQSTSASASGTQPAQITDTQQNSAPTQPEADSQTKMSQSAVANKTTANTSSGDSLPATASPLEILGLLGFGLVTLGVVARKRS